MVIVRLNMQPDVSNRRPCDQPGALPAQREHPEPAHAGSKPLREKRAGSGFKEIGAPTLLEIGDRDALFDRLVGERLYQALAERIHRPLAGLSGPHSVWATARVSGFRPFASKSG